MLEFLLQTAEGKGVDPSAILQPLRPWNLWLSVVLLAAATPVAQACDVNVDIAPSPSYWDGNYLTRTHDTRKWLEEHGVNFQLVYTGEAHARTQGGIKDRSIGEYLGNFDLTLELDTEKMGGWKGGTFHFYGENLHGAGITQDTGVFSPHCHLETEEPFTQLSEYWFRQEFFDGKLVFKTGKMDANGDFATTDTSGHFLQSAAGAFPTLSMPTFPDNGLGFVLFGKPAEFLTLQAAVYDGGPRGTSTFGASSFFRRERGHVAYAEGQFHMAPVTGWLPGTLRVGGWYHTGNFKEFPWYEEDFIDPPELEVHDGNHGLYLTLDQMLYKESDDKDDEQGLSIFFQAGLTPEERSEVGRFLGGGMAYRGLFPKRDEDVFGVYVAHSDFSPYLKASDNLSWETVIEATYRVQVTPFLALQPDFQYVIRPGGDRRAKDAAVLGLHVEVTF